MPPMHTVPPFQGAPALEINHPFHFKMAPGILLGPCCNHDASPLLRIWEPSKKSCDKVAAINGMLDALGDHEFYCASYSTKDQPHVQGLQTTLQDGIAFKDREIHARQNAGEDFSMHDIAKKKLHTLLSSTNRRMHKGFQEL